MCMRTEQGRSAGFKPWHPLLTLPMSDNRLVLSGLWGLRWPGLAAGPYHPAGPCHGMISRNEPIAAKSPVSFPGPLESGLVTVSSWEMPYLRALRNTGRLSSTSSA